MHEAKIRQFLDAILVSSRINRDQVTFQVPFKQAVWRNQKELTKKFFQLLRTVGNDCFAVS